jgi:hypothetical protein
MRFIFYLAEKYIFSDEFIMTRFTKSAHGKYIVSGKSFDMLIGTRAQVWHGTAYKTSGGLTKGDILQNKNGRIVSKSKHASAKRENRLVKAGYGTQKGKFGAVKLHGKSSRRHSRRHRGSRRHGKKRGGGINFALSPTDYHGQGVGTSGNAVQFAAGMGN